MKLKTYRGTDIAVDEHGWFSATVTVDGEPRELGDYNLGDLEEEVLNLTARDLAIPVCYLVQCSGRMGYTVREGVLVRLGTGDEVLVRTTGDVQERTLWLYQEVLRMPDQAILASIKEAEGAVFRAQRLLDAQIARLLPFDRSLLAKEE